MDAIPRLALLAAAAAALSLPTAGDSQEWRGGVIHTVDVPAPSLKRNLLGDPASRTTSIYLPPSYRFSRSHRYPVLYLLHGFAADNRAFISGNYQGLNIRVAMDSLIARGKAREMIVVTPNARNRYDGAFYANSPVTGNWEDLLIRDLIGYVDSHFRTIAARSGRAIAGHSMGGNGALRLGMRYPEMFSVVYAMSPYGLSLDADPPKWIATAWLKALTLTDTSQFRKAGFAADLLISESAVYSPDTMRRPFFVDFPFRTEQNRLVIDSAIAKKWRLPLSEVRQYSTSLHRERIGFDAGRGDAFTAIPRDVTLLDRTLTELGIPHVAELYDGGHADKIRQRLEQVALPFISASFEDVRRRGPARSKR
jgi:S-formylglutathione hydrolase